MYDKIYCEYEDDIEFYINHASNVKGKILEIGCGTGRIHLKLLEKGFDVYGIDLSEKMLKEILIKSKKLALAPKVFQLDMKNFSLTHSFDLIIIPFRSFAHNLSIDDQIISLKNIRSHLDKKGKLVLNLFFPNPEFIVKTYGRKITDPIIIDGKNLIIQRSSNFIDETNQIVEVTQKLFENNRCIWKTNFRIALIYKREFELLLHLAGFKKWEVYGGFNYEPLNSYRQEIVWIITN